MAGDQYDVVVIGAGPGGLSTRSIPAHGVTGVRVDDAGRTSVPGIYAVATWLAASRALPG
jgi:hypothetical protein